MKTTLYVIAAVTILLTSCAGYYSSASHAAEHSYIGMPIKEFKEIAGSNAILAAMESGYTVFKVYAKKEWTDIIIDVKFFYFDSVGILVKIDGGEFKQLRYQIEHINR